MRRRRVCVVAAALVTMLAAPAAAAEPPPGAIENLEFMKNLPEGRQATAINFLTYGTGTNERVVMLITGRFGLKSYDMADPDDPVLLDEVVNDDLVLPYDLTLGRTPSATRTYWQNEDMDVDQRRKLVFLSRDPRAFGGSTSSNTDVAGVYIVDAAASYWLGDYVIVADNARGIDILRLTDGARQASAARAEVVAPPISGAQRWFLGEVAQTELAPDPELGWVRPLPRT